MSINVTIYCQKGPETELCQLKMKANECINSHYFDDAKMGNSGGPCPNAYTADTFAAAGVIAPVTINGKEATLVLIPGLILPEPPDTSV